MILRFEKESGVWVLTATVFFRRQQFAGKTIEAATRLYWIEKQREQQFMEFCRTLVAGFVHSRARNAAKLH